MFFGVVLCALATLAAKGDLVYTSVFMGALAAMAGYWLSDRGDRLLDSFVKGRQSCRLLQRELYRKWTNQCATAQSGLEFCIILYCVEYNKYF